MRAARASVRSRAVALADRTIELWWIEAPDETRLHALAEELSRAERQRLSRMRIAARRREFIVGRAALRRILGDYLAVSPTDVDLIVATSGKPELAQHQLAFSLAHSGGATVVAVGARGAIGVDLEVARKLRRPERLAETLLGHAALAAWRSLPAAQQAGPILHAWTAMEAIIKALGRTLPGSLKSVRIQGAGTEWPQIAAIDGQATAARGWSLVHVGLPNGAIGAVAHDGPIDRIKLRKFRWPARRARGQKR